jgi:hypothetical protein
MRSFGYAFEQESLRAAESKPAPGTPQGAAPVLGVERLRERSKRGSSVPQADDFEGAKLKRKSVGLFQSE